MVDYNVKNNAKKCWLSIQMIINLHYEHSNKSYSVFSVIYKYDVIYKSNGIKPNYY
jgi:hypothetical protein